MERELGVEEKDGIKEAGGGERWRLSVLDTSLDGQSGRQTAKAPFPQ